MSCWWRLISSHPFFAVTRYGPDARALHPSPNRLVVDEASSDDNSVATLHPATMETLQLFRGDTIIVRGKKRKDTGECTAF